MSIHVVVHRDTSIHTKWFDKGLTPKAGEDLWGQAFVESLGVYAVVPSLYVCTCLRMHMYISVYIYISFADVIISMYAVYIYTPRGSTNA